MNLIMVRRCLCDIFLPARTEEVPRVPLSAAIASASSGCRGDEIAVDPVASQMTLIFRNVFPRTTWHYAPIGKKAPISSRNI